ncbi:MAG: hypothetical protein R2684_04195 [Pyrinomonadaceae bacterium]
MLDIHPGEKTPGVIRKHFDQVKKNWNLDPIYVTRSVPSYVRGRLIHQKIPFIVPNKQMYLPDIGVDLRERNTTARISQVITKPAPSTQAVVLYALLNKNDHVFNPSALADRLDYSPMTLSRAFDELESLEWGRIRKEGRERVLYFERDKRQLWESARDLLSSPIKKRFHVWPPIEQYGLRSGLTALSRYSMLAEPVDLELALGQKEWNKLKQVEKVETFPLQERKSGNVTIEVWNYDPRLLSDSGEVDRLSLYLSLRDEKDERVEAALRKMIGNIEW